MQRASAASREWNLDDARRFAAMLARIDTCPKPTVARVQGAALGGGVGLACACDIAIAADNASFAVSEARFGILPAVIGPYVVNAVGKRQARRLALTAARFGATEALGLGHAILCAMPVVGEAPFAVLLADEGGENAVAPFEVANIIVAEFSRDGGGSAALWRSALRNPSDRTPAGTLQNLRRLRSRP
jgi:enoyl-CoA hydratase/carnithine racemase